MNRFSLVIFLLLLAILGKFAWGPITAGLDLREKRIAAADTETLTWGATDPTW